MKLKRILSMSIAVMMFMSSFVITAFATDDTCTVQELCLVDSSGNELTNAQIESEDGKLYLKTDIVNNTSDEKKIKAVIARYKGKTFDKVAMDVYDIASKETLKIEKGGENELSIDIINDKNAQYKVFVWDALTNAPLAESKVYNNEKKIIFIGNSLTYYGGLVADGTQNTDDASMKKRFGDEGYFYQMAKQNDIEINVTNWTWGGHGIDDIFGESCAADRGHDGHNHYADFKRLSDMEYDYIVMQPTNRTALTGEALKEQIQMVKDAFSIKSPDAEYYVLIPTTYYINDTNDKKDFRKSFSAVEEETGVKIIPWGKLVSDLIDGDAVVENSSQTYNKNSFIISVTATDGYHPNQLTGYITTQFVFSNIFGKKAEGENYAFCTDSELKSWFDVDSFLKKYYKYDNISTSGTLKGDSLTNYPEIFESSTDMLGIQKLIDEYIEKGIEEEVAEDNKPSIIFIGNSLTYVGETVFDPTQNIDSTSLSARVADKGYFYQLAKQNNMEMNVVNWTWGGHSISHMLGESCAANRGHNGRNHLADLKNYSDMKYDYVVYQPTNSYTLTKDALKTDISLLKETFGTENPNAQYFILVPTTYYVDDTTAKAEFRNSFPEIEEETGVKFIQWGSLVADLIDGDAVVENSTQTYNKNTFMISASASDGYNPNQLAGYITTQFVFSTITGKKAEGENYAFCTDDNLHSLFDLDAYLNKYYKYDNISADGTLKGDSLTNYPEIFKSSTEMAGIQKLIDSYIN